jgi:hypothetical protein
MDEVRFYDTAHGTVAASPWPLLAVPGALRLDPRGARAALVDKGSVTVRELASEQVATLARADAAVVDVEFSPDGRWLAARAFGTGPSVENLVLLWDLEAPGTSPKSIPHGDQVRALAFSPDSRWLATGTKGQIAQVWSVVDGQPAGDPMFHAANVVRSVKFSPDGTRLATACGDQKLRLFDWREGRPVAEAFDTGGDTVVWDFSPDGTKLAQASPPAPAEGDGNAELGPALVRVFEVAPPPDQEADLVALTEAASALRVSPDGQTAACDPYEGWKRLAESSPDLWFFRSPAERSISPGFEATSSRWVMDESVTVRQTITAMPAVGLVRAALACWKRRDSVSRRVELAGLDPASPEAVREAAALAKLEREIGILVECAGREADRDPAIAHWLSLEAEADSDLPRAQRWIETARALAPDDQDTLEQARDIYVALQDHQAELAVRRRLLEFAPDDAQLRLALGHAHWRAGEIEDAKREFAAVLDRPEIETYARVQILTLFGRMEEAEAAWGAVNAHDPASAEIRTALYYVTGLMRVGKVEEAVEWYAALIPQGVGSLTEEDLRRAEFAPDVSALLFEALRETLARHPELAPK